MRAQQGMSRSGRSSRRTWLTGLASVAAVVLAGCGSSTQDTQWDKTIGVESCVVIEEGPDPSLLTDAPRSTRTYREVDCRQPHTHIVIALASSDAQCPAEADTSITLPSGVTPVRCLREE